MTDRTLKISDMQIDFIRLLLRSPDVGKGWRKIGKVMKPWVGKMADEHPELYELSEPNDDGLHVRLSPAGQVLGEYL